jgi:hypothetical protein
MIFFWYSLLATRDIVTPVNISNGYWANTAEATVYFTSRPGAGEPGKTLGAGGPDNPPCVGEPGKADAERPAWGRADSGGAVWGKAGSGNAAVGRTTRPVRSFGVKKVDFGGMSRPSRAVRSISASEVGRMRTPALACPERTAAVVSSNPCW